ncbi:MAG: hypothetical protein RR240_03875 [Burkholderiaceae bacterium]
MPATTAAAETITNSQNHPRFQKDERRIAAVEEVLRSIASLASDDAEDGGESGVAMGRSSRKGREC